MWNIRGKQDRDSQVDASLHLGPTIKQLAQSNQAMLDLATKYQAEAVTSEQCFGPSGFEFYFGFSPTPPSEGWDEDTQTLKRQQVMLKLMELADEACKAHEVRRNTTRAKHRLSVTDRVKDAEANFSAAVMLADKAAVQLGLTSFGLMIPSTFFNTFWAKYASYGFDTSKQLQALE